MHSYRFSAGAGHGDRLSNPGGILMFVTPTCGGVHAFGGGQMLDSHPPYLQDNRSRFVDSLKKKFARLEVGAVGNPFRFIDSCATKLIMACLRAGRCRLRSITVDLQSAPICVFVPIRLMILSTESDQRPMGKPQSVNAW